MREIIKKHLSYALYGLPALPLAALTLPVVIYLPKFYSDTLGLSMAVVGAMLLIARVWDMVSDPLIGMLSDRFAPFHAHRKGWVYLGVIPTLTGAWFLFSPPDDAGGIYLLFWSVVLYMGWSMMKVPLDAWGAELSDSYHERSVISGWREGLTIIGLLSVLGLIATFTKDGAESALGFIAYFLLIGLPLSVAFLWQVPDRRKRVATEIGVYKGAKIVWENAPFRRLIGSYLLNGVANAIPATLFLYYVEYIIGKPDMGGPLLFVYFLCGALAIPLWMWLAKHISKHHLWAYIMMAVCVPFAAVPFIDGSLPLFVVIVVLTGFGLGADLTLPAAMQSDVVDVDRVRSGESRAGLYFAAWGMLTKLALAGAYLVFPVMEGLGFDAQAGQRLSLIPYFYALLPVAFKIAAIALIWQYPLDREKLAEVQEKIKSNQT
tara:strand:- start:260 stop:1558 length:1299 start_codon:yes stop_codon:yes gene_type:complete